MVRYNYREGVTLQKKKSRWFAVFLGIIAAVVAVYLATTYVAPQLVTIPFTNLTVDAVDNKIQNTKPGELGDRLYIPQINVDIAVQAGGDRAHLNDGAWQRNTSLGDPEKGGNYALSAYKFTWGILPQVARTKSPFYNLGKLKDGDELTLDYHGKRYVYKIDSITQGEAGVMAEQKAEDEFRLTLYAVDANGDAVAGPVISAVRISPTTLGDQTTFGSD